MLLPGGNNMYKIIWNGFRFGTLLQIAIGPICLFIFQTAASSGLGSAEAAVLGVTLADIIYVLAAIWGVGTLIEKNERSKKYLKYFGALVLIIFGAAIISSAFGISMIPSLDLMHGSRTGSAFINALFLTLSSPLTIVFWAGVFSAKISENKAGRKEIYLFGAGAVISTLFFMSLTAIAGKFTGIFMSETAIMALNIIVGAVLVFSGAKTALTK